MNLYCVQHHVNNTRRWFTCAEPLAHKHWYRNQCFRMFSVNGRKQTRHVENEILLPKVKTYLKVQKCQTNAQLLPHICLAWTWRYETSKILGSWPWLLGSHYIICHLTIEFEMCDYLLIVHSNQPSTSCWGIEAQRFPGHDQWRLR